MELNAGNGNASFSAKREDYEKEGMTTESKIGKTGRRKVCGAWYVNNEKTTATDPKR